MPETPAGVLPPVDTWDPQVHAWVHAAWSLAEAQGRPTVALADLVRALWAAGDPWSRAYRHLFAGAPAPARPPEVVPEQDRFYAAEGDLIALFDQAAERGAGRITAWCILTLVAERTRASAKSGSPGATGVWTAPVIAEDDGGRVIVQRGVDPAAAARWADGAQVIAVIVDERLSSDAEAYATPYVEGHFHLLVDDAFVLREPGPDGFWVLEGVAPDALDHLAAALREARRRVPGHLAWLPLRRRLATGEIDLLDRALDGLQGLPAVLLSTDPSPGTPWDLPGDGADTLTALLDRLTGGAEGLRAAPVLPDHPLEADAFGHGALAGTLAASLALAETAPPLTLAILGTSGSGRSDLLRRLGAAWTNLPGMSGRQRERCHPTRVHLALRAPDLVEAPATAVLGAVLDALGAPTPPAATAAIPDDPPTPPTLGAALRVLLPGLGPHGHPLGPVGAALALAGALGTAATPAPWALLPAALAALGLTLAATAVGRAVVRPPLDAADAPPAPPPAPVAPPEARLAAWHATLEPPPRLLITLDDLDRVAPEEAARILGALHRHLLDAPAGQAPATLLALACAPATLTDAAPAEVPPSTLVQVPLWMGPASAEVAAAALAHFTGLDAPPVPRPSPRPTTPAPAAGRPPVPIPVEVDDTGLATPADLRALHAWLGLVEATPRTLKRLVNQLRLLRATTDEPLDPRAIAAWLALAEGAAPVATALAEHLAEHEPASLGQALQGLGHLPDAEALARVTARLRTVEPGALPSIDALRQAARASLRWTFVGPIGVAALPHRVRALRAVG